MQTLNGLVWPEIAKLATQEVRRFGAGKKGTLYSHVVHDTNSTGLPVLLPQKED